MCRRTEAPAARVAHGEELSRGHRVGTRDILCEVGCDDAEIEVTVAAKLVHAENAES